MPGIAHAGARADQHNQKPHNLLRTAVIRPPASGHHEHWERLWAACSFSRWLRQCTAQSCCCVCRPTTAGVQPMPWKSGSMPAHWMGAAERKMASKPRSAENEAPQQTWMATKTKAEGADAKPRRDNRSLRFRCVPETKQGPEGPCFYWNFLGWLMGLEPTTTGITILDSTN